jgi:hypothetical protein
MLAVSSLPAELIFFANNFVASAGFVKSVGAVFHPVWEQ